MAGTFSSPLYACEWIERRTETLIVGGGGGDARTGIPNRITLVEVDPNDSSIKSELCHVDTGDAFPTHILLPPRASRGVVALGAKVAIATISLQEDTPRVTLQQEETMEMFGTVKSVALMPSRTAVLLGGEEGWVLPITFPGLKSMQQEATRVISRNDEAVNALAIDPNGDIAIATTDDTDPPGASLLRFDDSNSARIETRLNLPRGMRGKVSQFRGCGFASADVVLLGGNVARGGAMVLHYKRDVDEEGWHMERSAKVFSEELISSFSLSREGELVAVGGSEGSIQVLEADSLRKLKQVKSAHMIFVTGLSFSPDGAMLASVSADGSARIHGVASLQQRERRRRAFFLGAILALLISLLRRFLPFLLGLPGYGPSSPASSSEL